MVVKMVDEKRYEELVKKEVCYEILKNSIVNNVRYSSYSKSLTIDDDRAVMQIFRTLEPDLYNSVLNKLAEEEGDNVN